MNESQGIERNTAIEHSFDLRDALNSAIDIADALSDDLNGYPALGLEEERKLAEKI